jgi:uncharacterized membrane protein YozB (DUF420 family)
VSSLLGTDAPYFSDVVALFEIATGIALVAGMFLVRAGHVRLHAYLQSAIVFVNIPVVLVWMVPSYLKNVYPYVGPYLNQPFVWVPTLMLGVGAVAEALGVYIVVAAGTNWLPEGWRFRRYKLWMRTMLGLWWSVLLLGLLTYYVWYVSPNGTL